jgi:superfamily II DNA or RNA helicase
VNVRVVARRPEYGYLDSSLEVPKTAMNLEGMKQALTFQFFDERTVKFLTLWRETPEHLVIPREFWKVSDLEFPVIDCRPRAYPRVEVKSRITLDFKNPALTIQRDAVGAMRAARGGILQLSCGKGKTVCALELIAQEHVPALIVVDNSQLLKQWQDAIAQFLEVPAGVGLIKADVFDWQKPVVLATYQTMALRADYLPEEVRRWFGLIILDEAHHTGAPTFSRIADLFPGKRIGLTATPERADGTHVIYDFHIGPIIYKNLQQDLKPRFYFVWTGLQLDAKDPQVRAMIEDKNGELHLGKLSNYFARWKKRLTFVLQEIRAAYDRGRRIIVVSKSVDELVNLLALWNGREDLFTDIPFPTGIDVGLDVPPVELDKNEHKRLLRSHAEARQRLKNPGLPGDKAQFLRDRLRNIETRIEQHACFKKCESLHHKNQKKYLKGLLEMPSDAGLMIYKISADERTAMLRSKRVMFIIAKYGREALDEQRLDTIIVSMPLSDRNGLQQLMGRVQREIEGKKEPVVVFLEDDVGPLIGMCKKLRKHLREWPIEESGPFSYENRGHPNSPQDRSGAWRDLSIRVPG